MATIEGALLKIRESESRKAIKLYIKMGFMMVDEEKYTLW